MNSFLLEKVQRKWTWASADGITKYEIDYIMTNHKSIVKNVTVLNKFSTGSDHRMVRAKVMLNTRFQRLTLVKNADILDIQLLKELSSKFVESLNGDLANVDTENSTLNELNDNIVGSIKRFLETRCKSVPSKESTGTRY